MINGYQKYKENTVNGMSQAELLLALFDKAISDLSKAEYALNEKEYGIFERSLDHTVKIVRYLIQILDHSQPLAADLREIYQYLIFDISRVRAGRHRRADEIGRMRNILSELRDAFDQADKKLCAEAAAKEHGTQAHFG